MKFLIAAVLSISAVSAQLGFWLLDEKLSEPSSNPYQAVLVSKFGTQFSRCGGSIIGTNAILTAAHCVERSESTEVIIGSQNQTVPESAYKIHDEYKLNNLANDIAILILPVAVTLDTHVKIVSLPTNSAENFVGQTATIWGHTESDNPTLEMTSNKVIDNVACKKSQGAVVTDRTICIGGGVGKDDCLDDSGSPLVVNKGGETIQIGVGTLFSAGGCSDVPGAFVRVSSYLDWINTIKGD